MDWSEIKVDASSFGEPMNFVEFTLGDVFDAIENNGLKQITGEFVQYSEGKPISACAIGQAAVNLKVDYNKLTNALNRFSKPNGLPLGDRIIRMNDKYNANFKNIAKNFRRDFKHVLDTVLKVEAFNHDAFAQRIYEDANRATTL